MDIEKQKQLFDKYPKIFAGKDKPLDQSLMSWGIQCGSGWYDLIDLLCSHIQEYIDSGNASREHLEKVGLADKFKAIPQIEAVQVKEKFGGLRFYISHNDEYCRGLIHMAESMSLRICEYCGKPGEIKKGGGYWIRTLCDPCREYSLTTWKKP